MWRCTAMPKKAQIARLPTRRDQAFTPPADRRRHSLQHGRAGHPLGLRCFGDIASEGELGTVGVAVLFLANALTSASRRARVTIFGTIAC
jgi:hypothetical protein